MADVDLHDVLTRYERAAGAFSRGDPEPIKAATQGAEDLASIFAIVHRHADPTTTPDPDGPLRRS
jgi:hypothetical protein